MEEQINRIIHQDADSIELGTPAKGGAIKVYLDFNNPDECEAKIQKALEIQAKANLLRAKYLTGDGQ